tara:strand:+ start:6550 stop:6714 length:165 start_codon:yes stop_codon:yes gene_type:complete
MAAGSALYLLLITGCGTWGTEMGEAVNSRINSQEKNKTDAKREKVIYPSTTEAG